MSDVIGYVSDPDEMATVSGRTYRRPDGGYLQAGEPIKSGGTRKRAAGTKLDVRGAGELPVGRATFPARDGKSQTRKATRGMGAVSAASTRMNPTGMNLRADKQDRRSTYRSLRLPGQVFSTRAAMRAAVAAA